MLDAVGFLLALVVTFGMGGTLLAGFFISLVVVPIAAVKGNTETFLAATGMCLATASVYYYFRIAAFIVLKLGRRGCKEASFRSVLCEGRPYFEFYLMHRRLRRLAAEYSHLLTGPEVARAAKLARGQRIATWICFTVFGFAILVTAVLASFGAIQPSG